MRHTRRLAAFALVPAFVALAACESGTAPAPRFSIEARAQTLNSIGDTMRLRLTDEAGQPMDIAGVQWSSSNPQVAPVIAGFLRTEAVGSTTITARLRGGEAQMQLTVRQVPARLRITQPKPSISIGETMQLTAALLDSAGTPLPPSDFTWSTSHPQMATVTAAGGTTTGVGSGRVRIRASGTGFTDSTTISVVYPDRDLWGPAALDQRFSFVPATLSMTGPDSVTMLTLHGRDQGAGLSVITLKVGKTSALFTCVMDNPVSGNAQEGVWACPVRRSQLAGPGTYQIVHAEIMDYGGSGFTAEAEYLAAIGTQGYLTVTP